ncbi:hypothetical protein ACI78R_11240 [Geodermatophilus sp. SYSU D01106]
MTGTPSDSGSGADGGTAAGTVVRVDDGAGAVLEVPGAPGDCWADAAVVEGEPLRAGQVVTVEWATPGAHGLPVRAVRVHRRTDLEGTPGA